MAENAGSDDYGRASHSENASRNVPQGSIPSKWHGSQGDHGEEGSLQMSSLAAALPPQPGAGFVTDPRYQLNDPVRQMPHYGPQGNKAQMQPYQNYPHHASQSGPPVAYPPYVDAQTMASPYSPLQGQYGPNAMFGSPQASPQYAGFPPGYGMQSHGQSTAYQDYVPINSSMMPSAPAGGRPLPGSQTGRQSMGNSSIPSAPRGPPRKPKQSGHALWVGNLPPGTRVGDLKDHFSRDATKDIESVFLISKSNCAFVNYKTEAACAAAMTRFHDSRFQGVRLVCRLRKGPGSMSSQSGPGSLMPSGPAALQTGSTQSQSAVDAISQNRESSARAMEAIGAAELTVNDKYFVVKSLTVEDLDLSVRNGIWATQSHNEEALNKAYETVENVFLIFSANKSGEYFGYARMDSPIDDDVAKNLEWKPFEGNRPAETHSDPDLPRSIPTQPTEFAPKGRIIDDSARGTIFWEADIEESENLVEGENTNEENEDGEKTEDGDQQSKEDDATVGTSESGAQTFGRPFRVRWVSTVKLPFYRTRGLRNPWNANREVKIARDGTELETEIGRRLVSMFHRAPTPQQIHTAQMQGQQAYMGQMPSPIGYGMPPMSPSRYDPTVPRYN